MNEIIEVAIKKRKQGFITFERLNEVIDEEFKRIRLKELRDNQLARWKKEK